MSVLITTTPANQANKLGIFTFGSIAGAASVVYNPSTSLAGVELASDPSVTSFSAPNLTSVDPTSTQQGGVFLSGNANLTAVSFPVLQVTGGDMVVLSDSAGFTAASFPALTTVKRDFSVGGVNFNYNSLSVPLLTVVGHLECKGTGTFSLPALTTVGGAPGDGTFVCSGNFSGTTLSMPSLVTVASFIVFNSATLTTISLPVWLPTPGTTITFFGCNALIASSVNAVLARCVANAAFTTGSVTLPGAAPTGQGITDKATLIGRGVSVTTS